MSYRQLLLLHGQPGSAADWRQVMARLPPSAHAVAVDRPGYGSSRRAAAGFTGNASFVLDELDSRGIAQAVLGRHSYGGGVALSAPDLSPPRVEGRNLLSSAGPGGPNTCGPPPAP